MEKEQSIQVIKELSDANGVSGFENEVVEIVKKYTQDLGMQKMDAIKNLYIHRKQNSGKQPIIQFDAHSDEVGFMVQAIKENGLLQFLPLGGWVPNNISAQKVRVKNREGDYVHGIVTSIPPHFLDDSQRNRPLKIADLSIDVGATSKQELEQVYKIDIGAPVVPAVTCEFDGKTERFLGKAFDCRIGCACMIDVLDELKESELQMDIVATLTAQEEVGERGAFVAAKQVDPDLAIVFEGCPADDTSVEDYFIQSAMGKGPMLRYFDISMITNPEFQQFAIDSAKKNKIPIQVSVRSGGGTNGMAITQVKGAPTIVVGIPVRYAHTPHCYVDYKDYQYAKELVVALVKSLNQEKINQLTHYME